MGMQWPPRPGPGVNFMKPKGLVAAASMTSHASSAELLGHDHDLVDEADVDRAERVLEQLDHLGRLGQETGTSVSMATP